MKSKKKNVIIFIESFLYEVAFMISENAIAAAKAAYDIEAQCITEMKEYLDTEAFSRAVELLSSAARIGASG